MNRLRFYWLGQKLVWEDRFFRWKRPVAPSLTVDPSLDDQALARAAFGTVSAALRAARGFGINKVRFLPPHWRAVYVAFYLNAEVNNGGFHQFFWNSEDALNDFLMEAVDFAGAVEIKAIVSDALKRHRGYDYPAEKARAGLSWDAFTQGYDENRFAACDKAYYGSKEKLLPLLGAAIKREAARFAGSS